MMAISLQHYLIVSVILFSIGTLGFLTRRNVIVALMSIELMLNAVNLALVAFNRIHQAAHTGQMFSFFIVAVAAAEAAVGLSIVIAIYRVKKTVRTDQADELSG